jgi:AcrR family transcriptional regulator
MFNNSSSRCTVASVAPGGDQRKRVRMDRDVRRREILRAAARLFGERPYSEVSVNDIADAAGVAKGLMHHYFGSKRELYLEVVREVATVPTVPLPEDDGLDSEQAWARGVDGFLGLIAQNPDLWLTSVTVGGAERDDEVASILDDGKEVLADQTLAAIGLADRADDPVLRALVRGYGGFVQELTVEWLARRRLDKAQVRAAFIATLPVLLEQVLPLMERATQPAGRAVRSGRS